MRDATLIGRTTLVTEECCNCGMIFAMSQDFNKRCRDSPSQKKFYCPAGHWQWYLGKSEETKLKRKLADTQEEVNRERTRRERAEDRTKTVEYQRNAFKGHLSKTKAAISCGKCPCCRRNFQNLQRHMAKQHPEYK